MTTEPSAYTREVSDMLAGACHSERARDRRAFDDIAPASELPEPLRAALHDAGLVVPSASELDTRALRLVTDEARALILGGLDWCRARSEHRDTGDPEEDGEMGGCSRVEVLLRRLILRRRLDLRALEQHDGYPDAIAELEALAQGLEALTTERPELVEHAD